MEKIGSSPFLRCMFSSYDLPMIAPLDALLQTKSNAQGYVHVSDISISTRNRVIAGP
jgi:hypothetical protein